MNCYQRPYLIIMIFNLVCMAALFLFGLYCTVCAARRKPRGRRRKPGPTLATALRPRKAAWVRHRVLALKEQHSLSHRKLADLFNQLYFAKTGVSVGRTWVRELLIREAHIALHRQRELKHSVPVRQPNNRMWGVDTTCVTDGDGIQHIVLGAIDHGSRLNLMLRHLKRFNQWTLLGSLFLAIGQYGRPSFMKTDNHPVFRGRLVKRVLRWSGVGLRHSRPARPWENGYIERLFGTFKQHLCGYLVADAAHLQAALPAFQFWYNVTRPHQNLGGQTPQQAWLGIDPWTTAPRASHKFSAWGGRLRGMVLRH
ncbi:transposase [Duganella sp. FT80W]|uniref:Transposase n=1 Tax=Duganella guangzhouensis TaxID=2666084 RepID=A0A6I2L7I3_9BURK|nr:integrase core domain-containing protein [Duganella guangzhouensis]MRW94195.1 transposase [Duganella guangzhouensis]